MTLGFILASLFWLAFFTAPYINLWLGSPFEPWAWCKLEEWASKHDAYWMFTPFDIEEIKAQLQKDLEK